MLEARAQEQEPGQGLRQRGSFRVRPARLLQIDSDAGCAGISVAQILVSEDRIGQTKGLEEIYGYDGRRDV